MNRILKDQNSQDLRKASICRVSCRVAQRTIHYMWGNCVSPDSFTGLLVSIFFILGSIGILNHAMWRDEINVWLIARDSASIMELFSNIKYEGHPGLWYICLYLLNQITHNPVIMQIFHLLLATGVIYIFVKLSPFTRLQKVLFCFGYLPFYEYLLISRNYAIGVLLTFHVMTLLSYLLFCL